MPPYLHRRPFQGWDWFTPREIQHLPWREQERLTQDAWEIVRCHPRFWLIVQFPLLLGCLVMGFAGFGLLLKMSSLIFLPINLTFMALTATSLIWQHRRFRKALRKKLLDAGIRPRVCFECGYEVEGYEGKECPACDALLLRERDSLPERS